jgi:sensor histidine kinase regulating citrate/malate metabolism
LFLVVTVDVAVAAPTEVALTVGTAGSLLIADRVHRQTRGLEPAVIARHYQHHQAMLLAVREGLIITGQAGKLVLPTMKPAVCSGYLRGGGHARAACP